MRHVKKLMHGGKLLMYTRKSNSPRILHCGIPDSTGNPLLMGPGSKVQSNPIPHPGCDINGI